MEMKKLKVRFLRSQARFVEIPQIPHRHEKCN